VLRTELLAALPAVEAAFGHTVTALVRVQAELNRQINALEGELVAHLTGTRRPSLTGPNPAWEPSSPPGQPGHKAELAAAA